LKKQKSLDRIFVNKDIRSREVRCIDKDDKNLGVMSTYNAIKLAQSVDLDLVMISPSGKNQTPICKIIDAGKYKYVLSKRKRDLSKKRRETAIKIKEIKFRPSTNVNDLRTKAKKAQKFLEDGCRIKIAINFKGREISHKDVAYDRLMEFIDLVGVAEMFEDPNMSGRQMTCMLSLNKNHNKELRQTA